MPASRKTAGDRHAARQRLAFPLAVLMGAPLLARILRPPLPLAGAALVVSGLGCGYQLGIQQAFLDSLPPRLRGQAFGLSATGAMGGQGLVPPAAGGLATILAAVALRGPLTGHGNRDNTPDRNPVLLGEGCPRCP
jgi:MFS family permease